MTHIAIKISGLLESVTSPKFNSSEKYNLSANSMMDLIDVCDESLINCLTIGLFNRSELWNMPINQKKELYNFLIDFFHNNIIKLIKERDYQIRFIGDIGSLPLELIEILSIINAKTLNNRGMLVVFSLNNSLSYEVSKAFNLLLESKVVLSDMSPIDVGEFEKYLELPTVENPDKLVMTNTKNELDDFMQYQCRKSKIIFFDKPFYNMNREDFYKIIEK